MRKHGALSTLSLWHVRESPPNASVKVKSSVLEFDGRGYSQLCSFLAVSPWARGVTSLISFVPAL